MTATQAAEYLSERLPYPVWPQDVTKWYGEQQLRGERKAGGRRVFYTVAALDEFVAADEERRTREHLGKKANAQSAKSRKIRGNITSISTEAAIAEIKKIARGSA